MQISGDEVRLMLGTNDAIEAGEQVQVSYTKPSSGNTLQDPYENRADTVALVDVVNIVDTTAPAHTGTAVAGGIVALNFNEDLDEDSEPDKEAFTVTVDGSVRLLQSVAIDGDVVRLTLVTTVVPDDSVTVTYTDPGVGNNRLQDSSGNLVESIEAHSAVNKTPPTLQRAAVRGDVLTLTFNNAHALKTTSRPAASAFTVRVGGTMVDLATTEPVRVTDSAVMLTLAEGIPDPTTMVEVRYIQPTGGQILRDIRETAVAAFDFTVAENLTDIEPPEPVAAEIAGRVLTLTFNEDLDEGSEPDKDAFTVTVNGVGRLVESVDVAGKDARVTLVATVAPSDTVAVSYDPGDAGNNPLRDSSYNNNSALMFTIPNSTVAQVNNVTRPSLRGIAVVGADLTLTFDKELDSQSTPAPDAFTVRVDGTEKSPDAVEVSGSTVTLTLDAPVGEGSSVEVRYSKPEMNPLQDARGGAVETFDFTSAGNVTDTTPPVVSRATPPAVNGAILVITFNERLNARSVPAPGDFTVTVEDDPRDVTGVVLNGSVVTLTLARAVTARQNVLVGYKPGANPLRDARANAVKAFAGVAVTNHTANSQPVFPADAPTVLSVPENSLAGTPVGAVAAADADGDTLRYTLDLASRALFAIGSGGAIAVAPGAALDFEGKDSHSVTVTASDGKASAAHTLTIRVTNVPEPPGPPLNVTVRLATFNSLEVNWTAPASAGALPVTDYDVRYYAGNADPPDPADWIEPDDAGGHDHMGEATTATIAGLVPDRPYRVQVRAVGDGAGRWSDSATVQTNVVPTVPFFDDGETVAFGIPENNGPEAEVGTVEASDDDGDTLSYSLTSASAEHRRFTIDNEGVIRVAPGVTLDHEDKAAYTLMAQVWDGRNADGNGEAVPEVDDTIEVSVTVENVEEPPGPPTGVTVDEATQTGLDLVWTAPADTGALPVSAYEVQYRLDGAAEWTDHPHDGTATSAAIGDLSAGRDYDVRVRALGDGAGAWSTGQGRTLLAPPVVAGELPDLALVVGSPPHPVDASGVLSGQNVTWEPVSSDSSIVSVIEHDGPRFMLRGEAAGEARVTVTASNDRGSASLTMAVTVMIASEEEAAALRNVLGGQARTLLSGATGVIGNRIAQWRGPALSAPSFTAAGARPMAVAGRFGADRAGLSGLHGAVPAGGAVPAVGAPAPSGAAHGGSWNGPLAFSLDVRSLGFAQTNGRRRLLPPPTRDNGPVPAPEGVPWWTVWGAGDVQTFSGGGEGASAYEGDWRTAWLGTDLRIAQNAMFGLALSFGEGLAEYGFEGPAAGAGQLETSLAAVYPYIKGATRDGATEFWLLAGGGAGEALNRREVQQTADEADLSMGLFAAGVRLRMMEGQVMRLSVLADLGAAMLQAEGENSLADLESKAQRVRVGLELAGAGDFSPFFQFNGRYDGDGEMYEGGYEAEGGLRYSGRRIDFEVRGRWMALAGDTEYEEAGASASLRFKAADGAGLSVALRPAWGRTGASDIVWGDGRMGAPHPVQIDDPALTLDGELGYGIRSWRLRGLLTPTLGYGRGGYGDGRLKLGANYAANPEWLPVQLGIELGIERRLATDGPGYGGRIRGTLRW